METTTPSDFSSQQRKMVIAATFLVCLVLISVILQQLGSILKPFFIAVFMVYILDPGVTFLTNKKIPRVLCYIIMVLIVFLIGYLLGVLIYANLGDFTRNSVIYEARLNDLIGGILKRLGIIENNVEMRLRDMTFLKWLPAGSVTTFFSSSLGSFFDLIGNSAVVAFFMLFLFAEMQCFGKRIQHAYGADRANHILIVVQKINQDIRKYILVKVCLSLGEAILATITFSIFGLDFFILLGVFTFLLNFIPYIGSILATILPTLIAFLQFDSPWIAFWLLVILLLVQNSISSIVEPKITGKKLNLSPLVVLISVMFWGWLWGSVGMIIAIPIMVTIRIIFEQIEITRHIAVMMSDM